MGNDKPKKDVSKVSEKQSDSLPESLQQLIQWFESPLWRRLFPTSTYKVTTHQEKGKTQDMVMVELDENRLYFQYHDRYAVVAWGIGVEGLTEAKVVSFWEKHVEKLWLIDKKQKILALPSNEWLFGCFLKKAGIAEWSYCYRLAPPLKGKCRTIRLRVNQPGLFHPCYHYFFETTECGWEFVKKRKKEVYRMPVVQSERVQLYAEDFKHLMERATSLRGLEINHLNELTILLLPFSLHTTSEVNCIPLQLTNGVEELFLLVSHCEFGGDSRLFTWKRFYAHQKEMYVIAEDWATTRLTVPKTFLKERKDFFRAGRFHHRLSQEL